MDIKHHLETAWEYSINNVVPLVILTLVFAAVSVCSLGILFPAAFAGYTNSLFQLLNNNREPKAQDIFSQLNLFLPLFIFGIAVFIIVLIGFSLLIIPGILISTAISYLCLYMIPIMVDQQYGLIDAVKKSSSMVTSSPIADHIIIFIIFLAFTTIGGSSFIGFLFLQPFATLFLLSVYKKLV
jgi:hypothetical protein